MRLSHLYLLVACLCLFKANSAVLRSRLRMSAAQRLGKSSLGGGLVPLLLLPFNAIGKSAKVAVSSSAGWAVLSSSSWVPLYYICGALCNALMSKIIKRVVRQPRPTLSKKGGYGMPSSHAHLLFYFFTILTLLSRKHYPSYLSSALSAALGCYAVTAAYWRVADGLHTLPQTLVGASLGVSMGCVFHFNQHHILSSVLASFRTDATLPVPNTVKIPVLVFGFLVLFKKEISAFRSGKDR